MEEYQRKKLYLIHLKNISEIKNGKVKKAFNSYSSRIFNQTQNQINFRHTHKEERVKLNYLKKNGERQIKNLFVQKQNLRLGARLINVPSLIKMQRYQKEYFEHRKLMKLRSKIKPHKAVTLYKIHDIAFKGISPDPQEQFTIIDVSSKQKLMKGTIYELRKNIIKVQKDQNIDLKIIGRMKGAIKLNQNEMIPLFYKKQIVGTVIVQVF